MRQMLSHLVHSCASATQTQVRSVLPPREAAYPVSRHSEPAFGLLRDRCTRYAGCMQVNFESDASAGVSFLADVGASDGHPVLRLTGELDMVTADTAVATAERALQRGASGSLIVDLSELSFCDSIGMRALAQIARAAELQQRTMLLRGTQSPVRRVLEIGGFDCYFEI